MLSAIGTFFAAFLPGAEDATQYRLAASLDGHEGAINAFAFNAGSSLLASGGDDEKVKIWDLKTYQPFQTLIDNDQRWGQITTIKFINRDVTHTGMEQVCFGTGRGQFLLYRRSRKSSEFTEYIHQEIFGPGDSIESFAFDPTAQRFAITSHYGQLQVFRVEDAHLTKLWEERFVEVIPRAVSFNDHGASVIVYTMETGMMDTETAAEKYSRPLKSPIGNVDVCTSSGQILIDNMRNGFDLYLPNRTTPIRTFKINTSRRFVRNGVFAEMGKVVVCGSDHGNVYVFGIDDGEPRQILRHGGTGQMVQAVEATSIQTDHIVVSGSSTGKCNIHVWRKTVQGQQRGRAKHGHMHHSNFQLLVNIVLVLLVLSLTSGKWLPPIEKQFKVLISHIGTSYTEALQTGRNANRARGYNKGDNAFAPRYDADDPSVNLMEIFTSLDDDTLRRVFRMGSLTESELRDIGSKPSEPELEPSMLRSSCGAGKNPKICKAAVVAD